MCVHLQSNCPTFSDSLTHDLERASSNCASVGGGNSWKCSCRTWGKTYFYFCIPVHCRSVLLDTNVIMSRCQCKHVFFIAYVCDNVSQGGQCAISGNVRFVSAVNSMPLVS